MKKQIIKLIEESDKIAFFHHERPDGDAISSSYALMKAFEAKWPNKQYYFAGEYPLVQQKFELLNIKENKEQVTLDSSWTGVVGDVSGINRIYNKDLLLACGKRICFDHHTNNIDFEADIFWHEPTYPASAMQSYEIARELDIKWTEELAMLFLYGIITDTNRFQYSLNNIDALVFASELFKYISSEKIQAFYEHMARRTRKSLEFEAWALANIQYSKSIAYLVVTREIQEELKLKPDSTVRPHLIANIEGYDVWIQFIQYEDHVRVEYRSNGFAVNEVAKHFNGGGHIKASGCKLDNINDYIKVVEYTQKAIDGKI